MSSEDGEELVIHIPNFLGRELKVRYQNGKDDDTLPSYVPKIHLLDHLLLYAKEGILKLQDHTGGEWVDTESHELWREKKRLQGSVHLVKATHAIGQTVSSLSFPFLRGGHLNDVFNFQTTRKRSR
jgi:hypothetical protein